MPRKFAIVPQNRGGVPDIGLGLGPGTPLSTIHYPRLTVQGSESEARRGQENSSPMGHLDEIIES